MGKFQKPDHEKEAMLPLADARTSDYPSSCNSKNLFSSTLVREILIRSILAELEESPTPGECQNLTASSWRQNKWNECRLSVPLHDELWLERTSQLRHPRVPLPLSVRRV